MDRSKYEICGLKIEIDDLQQYSRRRSVRIEGLEYKPGETEDDLFTTIQTSLKEVDIAIEPCDVIRFHRSTKPKKNRDGVMCAQTLVKFARWQPRKLAHYGNKKARVGGKKFRIHHDLTKRRYDLLKRARAQIEIRCAAINRRTTEPSPDHRDKVFAYADVNSNLLFRSGVDSFPFNTERDIDDILDDILRN